MQSITNYLDSVPLTYHEFKEFVVQEVQLHPVAAVASVLFPVIGISIICYLGVRKIHLAMNSETEQKVSGVGQRILEKFGLGTNSPHEKMIKSAICVGVIGVGITAIGYALRCYYTPEETIPDFIPVIVPDLNKNLSNLIPNVSDIMPNVSDIMPNVSDILPDVKDIPSETNVTSGSFVAGFIDCASYGLNMSKELLGSNLYHGLKIATIGAIVGYSFYEKNVIENKHLKLANDKDWFEAYKTASEKRRLEELAIIEKRTNAPEHSKPQAQPIVQPETIIQTIPKKEWKIYNDI